MRRLMLLLLVGLLLVGDAWATYVLFTSRYPGANDFASRWVGSPIWILTRFVFPALGVWGEAVLSVLAVAFLVGALWRASRQETARAFEWAVGVCLIATNLVALRTATTNYVVLLLPLAMTFRALERGRTGPWLVLLVEVVLLVGLWVLFLTTVVAKFEHPVVYLPLPLGLLAIFALGRRRLVMERTTSVGFEIAGKPGELREGGE